MLSTDPLRLRHTHHRTHVSEIWTKTRHAVESGRLSRRPDRLQSSHIIRGTHDRAHLYQSRERRVRSIVSVAPTGFHLHCITACSVRVSHLFRKRFAHHHHRPVQLVNDIFYCRSLLVGQQMVRDMGTDRCSCTSVVHERATKLGIYTVALCLGATGPLYAGYMVSLPQLDVSFGKFKEQICDEKLRA